MRKWRGNGERMRKWRGNGERMRKWREIDSLHFLILSPFPPPFPSFPHYLSISSLSISISYIKICHILSHNVKYGTFVANVTKILTYALWGNNSGSNLLWGSSASCAGLLNIYYTLPNSSNFPTSSTHNKPHFWELTMKLLCLIVMEINVSASANGVGFPFRFLQVLMSCWRAHIGFLILSSARGGRNVLYKW